MPPEPSQRLDACRELRPAGATTEVSQQATGVFKSESTNARRARRAPPGICGGSGLSGASAGASALLDSIDELEHKVLEVIGRLEVGHVTCMWDDCAAGIWKQAHEPVDRLGAIEKIPVAGTYKRRAGDLGKPLGIVLRRE
jgi:hypothetical protein